MLQKIQIKNVLRFPLSQSEWLTKRKTINTGLDVGQENIHSLLCESAAN